MIIIPEKTPNKKNQIQHDGKTYELGSQFSQGKDARASGLNIFMINHKGVVGLALVEPEVQS